MGKDSAQPYVYVYSEESAWIPGRQIKSDGKTATVAVQKYKDEDEMLVNASSTSGTKIEQLEVKLKDYKGGVLPMQNVDDRGKLGNHEDMVNLPYLHEAAILYNIKKRHGMKQPYTRTGDMVVAVNPYQWIDTLYTDEQRKKYATKLVWENSEDDPRQHLAPHVYETSALSYKGMAFDGFNQSILVSGESGAGKTETVKICMNHIASVQEGPGQSKGPSVVVQRIVESNPLLEAFGNAKTRRNDNSSRFGKYLQLQFEGAGGVGHSVAKLAGSRAEVFLLEKNRVTQHDTAERTYHIFYQIIAAPDGTKMKIWDGLQGSSNESFKYVGSTDTNKIEGRTDAEHFQSTYDVLKVVGLVDDDIYKFMRAICIVLQLGNLAFGPDGDNVDKSSISNGAELTALAKLMEIPEAEMSLALTERTIKTRDETLKVPLNPASAKEGADALAGEIYGKVFLWVVKAINAGTDAENQEGAKGKKFGIVGLLDIFGFESFNVNRFEQLCINYANEKLQQKFTEDIFKAVMEEYKYEGIPLEDIKYDDNTDVLDLIESRTGLCALLNEECVRPKGSGEGFVNKALGANKSSPCLIPDKTDRMSFGIRHYAGTVYYDATHFVPANQDTLPTDLEDAAMKCSNSIIANAFTFDKYAGAAGAAGPGGKRKPKRQKSNIMAPTVWTKYKTQLSSLMTSLYATHSRYIRCIKPNTVKKPLKMEHKTTMEQLRNAGIVAGVTISRSAFPNRLNNSVVYARYSSMWDKAKYPAAKSGGMSVPEKVKADCEAIMTCALKSKETTENGKTMKAFVVGKTRTYFRSGALEYLESQRVTGLDAQAIAIQKAARGFLVRKELGFSRKDKKEAAMREEQERQERLKREREELDAKMKKEIGDIGNEAKELQKQIKYIDEDAGMKAAEINEETSRIEAEKLDLQKRIHDIEASGIIEAGHETERLKVKLDANMKLIETLKKENKKIHKSFDKIDDRTKSIKANNKILTDKLGEGNDVEGELSYANTVNERLLDSRQKAIDDNSQGKEDVANMQGKYMAVAESRLELQRTLAQILNIIGDKCTDKALMEDIYSIAHSCEAEAKVTMEALEANSEIQ